MAGAGEADGTLLTMAAGEDITAVTTLTMAMAATTAITQTTITGAMAAGAITITTITAATGILTTIQAGLRAEATEAQLTA